MSGAALAGAAAGYRRLVLRRSALLGLLGLLLLLAFLLDVATGPARLPVATVLDEAQMAAIDALDAGEAGRTGKVPGEFND